jgi:pimeloyl-ACP methyl ester carboxylesterase
MGAPASGQRPHEVSAADREENAIDMATTQPAPARVLTLADGREMAVDVTGPQDGPTVLFFHAAPGSRVFDPDPAVTAAAGVRLVTVDRPGYGRSSPRPADVVPTVAAIASDLVATMELLGIDRAPVIGWSGGGRVGAALAAHRPELVTRLVVVGTPAPDDRVPWVPDEYRRMSAELRREPRSAVASLSESLAPMAEDPAAAVESLAVGAADEAVLADPARRAQVVDMLTEGLRPGVAGLATDIVADQVVPWGFDVEDVSVPTVAFYGDADVIVSPAHGRWYADTVADGELRVVPGAGHLVVMTAWRDILDAAMLPG